MSDTSQENSFATLQDKFDHDLNYLTNELNKINKVLDDNKDKDKEILSPLLSLKGKVTLLIYRIKNHPLYHKDGENLE